MDMKSETMYPVTNQPPSPANMDLYNSYHTPSNANPSHHNFFSPHHRHHTPISKRWLLVPALLSVLSLILVAFVALAQEDSTLSGLLFGYNGQGDGLVRRAVDNGTNGNGTFVNRKLYLIIVFVGLFLVVVAGIMLSFWCCRGSFENPLCCPCYLCACCGGMACLECVGCGLCADAIEQG